MYDFDRPEKNEVRLKTLRSLRGRRFKSILTLPASGALCVRSMLEVGLIDQTTKQTWVERDAKTCSRLRAVKTNLGLNKVNIEHSELEDYEPDSSFGLINADMTQAITPRLAMWFEKNARFMSDSVIILNTPSRSGKGRNNAFPEHFTRVASDRYSGLVRGLLGFTLAPRVEDVLPNLMLLCALREYEVVQLASVTYGDSRQWPMVTTMIMVAGKTAEPQYPALSEFLEGYVPARREPWTLDVPEQSRQFRRFLATAHQSVVLIQHKTTWHLKFEPINHIFFSGTLEDAMKKMNFQPQELH